MKKFADFKWALVLSGGGAKGIAHVGVLKALYGMGIPAPSMIVGTSMGSIIGGLYASGMSPEEIYRFAVDEFDLKKYLDGFVYKLNGFVGKVFQTGQIIGNLATRQGIDSGQQILSLLERMTNHKKIEDTQIPFRCNAVDLCTGNEIVFKTGSLAKAMRASMSFPGFFDPVISGDMCLVDGGLSNNLPICIPHNEGLKTVLAVDVAGFSPASMKNLKSGSQIIYRSLELVLHNSYKDKSHRANLTIHASNEMSPLDFDKSKQFIDLGEKAIAAYHNEVEQFFSKGIAAARSRKKYTVCGIFQNEQVYKELDDE
jgi:NTE family protein